NAGRSGCDARVRLGRAARSTGAGIGCCSAMDALGRTVRRGSRRWFGVAGRAKRSALAVGIAANWATGFGGKADGGGASASKAAGSGGGDWNTSPAGEVTGGGGNRTEGRLNVCDDLICWGGRGGGAIERNAVCGDAALGNAFN
ncbi:MAG: hypothetical protein ACKVH0_13145, partial [Alphaproteobacteria bacterium]